MANPRWEWNENDGRFTVSDRDSLFSFEIIPFMRRGKVATHLSKDERKRLAMYIVDSLNHNQSSLK